jgi:hypothetical protein
MGEDGGHPPDFGHLSDEDMSEILRKAADAMASVGTVAPGDYLYHRQPLMKG